MNDQNANFIASSDNLEPRLEAAVWAVLSEPIPADAVARVKSHALALDDTGSANNRVTTRNTAWTRPWIQVAALAACVLVALAATMMLPSSSRAFAQAIEKLKNAGAFRYKEFVYLTAEEKPVEVEVWVSDDGRERRSTLGMVSICDATGQVRLSLNESAKSATVHARIEELTAESDRQTRWLERLKSYGKKPNKELGTRQIDGRECLGFEVKPAVNAVFSVWVDALTGDLVQVEFVGMPKSSSVAKTVLKDFAFNQSFDPKLFSFEPPQDYQSTNAPKLPKALPLEESLIEALKGYTELSGGKFPKSISDWGEWTVLMAEKGLDKDKMVNLAGRLGTLLPHLTVISQDDYDYTGAGVEVGAKRVVVFWYRKPDKQIRAVFSDFTAATIAEADLPAK